MDIAGVYVENFGYSRYPLPMSVSSRDRGDNNKATSYGNIRLIAHCEST